MAGRATRPSRVAEGVRKVAVDSSVIFAILKGEADASAWVELLIQERTAGTQLVACDVVWAEVSTLFPDPAKMNATMEKLEISLDPIMRNSAFAAGEIFRKYRDNGGPREHLIPDFLIGAHASHQADAIMAADRGYLRKYFADLTRLGPTA